MDSILRNKASFQADSDWSALSANQRPLENSKKEIREAVELPLTHMNMYKAIGIDPPRNHSLKFFKNRLFFSLKQPILNGYKEVF